VAIVANPFSGRGPNAQRVLDLVEQLAAHGLASRTLWNPAERAATLRDAQLMSRCLCVIAAGGDGTLADVINEPVNAPLAAMPLGNENLFARQFGFTRDTIALVRAIRRGRVRTIDLGQAGRRRFTIMTSVGFDAAVVHHVQRWRADESDILRRVNRMSYAGPIIQTLRKYDYPELIIETDGRTIRGHHLFVFNLPQYGGRLPFAPEARADDGLLDWVLFQRPGTMNLAHYAWSVCRRRHHRREDVQTGRSAELHVSAGRPAAAQHDGDPCGFTPLHIRVQPAALKIIDMQKAASTGSSA
jgi:diacylglycerol kinase family enzyme